MGCGGPLRRVRPSAHAHPAPGAPTRRPRRQLAGPIDCAVKTVRAEGILALYKSWLTVYMRLGPWQMVFYLTFEQVNKLASVKAM